jgi:DNA-binding MarR family transcriptional regulator
MSEQLQKGLSQRQESLSSPSQERLRAWRLYFESALALTDVLEAELDRDAGIPLRWYDALVQLEETPGGLRMNELAERILYSKSGFTRVVDRMEEGGLVRRVRPEDDRRSIFVVLTDEGRATLERARGHHRHSIEQHFASHLTDGDVEALVRALEKVSAHARPLRPGRVRS